MGKNNRARRKHKQRLKKQRQKDRLKAKRDIDASLGPVFHRMGNPFSGLNDEERKQVVKEIAEKSEEKYQEALKRVRELFCLHDPSLLLSVLASYGLTVGVGERGVQVQDSDLKLYQAHVEICQAVALQIPKEELGIEPCGFQVIQDLWERLDELVQFQTFRGMSSLPEDITDQDIAIRSLQQRLRGHTQMVRNWGSFSQVKNISREIYSVFDHKLEERYGFSASQVIDTFLLIIKKIETANTKRLHSLKSLYSIKDKKELVYAYYDLIGQPASEADEFISNQDVMSIPIKSIFAMLLSHYDLFLSETYGFTPEKLYEELGVEPSVIEKILDRFSIGWGGLHEADPDHIYLSNPVWLKPIIKDADSYLCFIPQMFFSFVLPSIESLIEEFDKKSIPVRRSRYLEDKIVEIINRRFPESNTISGVKWKDGDTEYETDLITFVDSHALIVEAKSHKISAPALRGAPARIKRHIEEVLVAPNLQSQRLKRKIEQLLSAPDLNDDLREKLPVSLSDIHKVIRVSVSLEDFATIQSNVAQIRETGWLPDDFEPCPTMNLADFETLFDFLEHPVQIIHYLESRQELEANVKYLGDELDLMGLYIGTLFNIGTPAPEDTIIISEMSAPLDNYYNSKDAGYEIEKPQPKISPLFKGIFMQLEERKTPRWTEIGVLLNRFSPDDQIKLTNMVEKLETNVRKNWMIEGHNNMAVCVPGKNSKYALCFVLYNNLNEEKRKSFIDGAFAAGVEAEHVEQCLVIARNIDDDLQYNFIGLGQ